MATLLKMFSQTRHETVQEHRGDQTKLIQIVGKIVLENARVKKKQLIEVVAVSVTNKILHDPLGMTKVRPKWVPRLFHVGQKKFHH